MGDWYRSVMICEPKIKEKTGVEKESERDKLALGMSPCKIRILSCIGGLFFLDRVPFNG